MEMNTTKELGGGIVDVAWRHCDEQTPEMCDRLNCSFWFPRYAPQYVYVCFIEESGRIFVAEIFLIPYENLMFDIFSLFP